MHYWGGAREGLTNFKEIRLLTFDMISLFVFLPCEQQQHIIPLARYHYRNIINKKASIGPNRQILHHAYFHKALWTSLAVFPI